MFVNTLKIKNKLLESYPSFSFDCSHCRFKLFFIPQKKALWFNEVADNKIIMCFLHFVGLPKGKYFSRVVHCLDCSTLKIHTFCGVHDKRQIIMKVGY